MSWWPFCDDPTLVCGDKPADILDKAFDDVWRVSAPTVQALLDALDAVMRDASLPIVADRDALAGTRITHTNMGPIVGDGDNADPATVSRLAQALVDVAAAYQERWERRPHVAEILGCMTFSIGGPRRDTFDGPTPPRLGTFALEPAA